MPRLSKKSATFSDSFDANAPRGSVSTFPGMPLSLEEHVYWSVIQWDPGNVNDQLRLTDSASSPSATGLEWTLTELGAGGGSTLAYILGTHPPALTLITDDADTEGWTMQANVGTRTLFDLTSTGGLLELAMYGIFRMKDANNDAATLTQSQFYMGFAATDTSLFTAFQHGIGLFKGDGSSIIQAVADDDSAAPGAFTNRKNMVDLSTASSTGSRAVNQYFMLGFRARVRSTAAATADLGKMDVFFDIGKEQSPLKKNPTHVGSMALGEVAGAAMCPTIGFVSGEAVEKKLDIAKIVVAAKYRLGAIA